MLRCCFVIDVLIIIAFVILWSVAFRVVYNAVIAAVIMLSVAFRV